MKIRTVTLNDAPIIMSLLVQMGYQQNIEQVQTRINAYLNNINHNFMVAEKDGTVVGCIAFVLHYHLLKDGRCCHIDTLIVDEKHRSQRIGEALINYAEKYAVENNCVTMDLFTLERRRETGTHAFYARLGYKDQEQCAYTYFTKEGHDLQPS